VRYRVSASAIDDTATESPERDIRTDFEPCFLRRVRHFPDARTAARLSGIGRAFSDTPLNPGRSPV